MNTVNFEEVKVEEIEVFADQLVTLRDFEAAAQKYQKYGALVVRGLAKAYIQEMQRDFAAAAATAIAQLHNAKKITEGWSTPDGTLWLPATAGIAEKLGRDKQIMILPVNYQTSGAFLRSAVDPKLLGLVSAIIGPDVELFTEGQSLYKEPVGGHPKNLHQDSAYFEHRFEGPVAVLNYAVDTNLQNGALYVVPGSHRMGTLRHIDTFSHLGLDEDEWPWEKALPICGNAGDSIFFHYKTIHGSQENHSDKPRPVFIHRYRHPNDFVTVSATTTESRAKNEKAAESATKQNQRGWMVKGFRNWEAS